jgi:hypothetical protein
MKVRSIILNTCLITSIGCVGVGYLFAGYWLIVPALLVMAFFWIFTKQRSVFGSASSVLLGFVILAAIGIIADLSLNLMLIACTTALVSWDLMQFNQSRVGNPLHKTNSSLEKYHLQSLASAASAGLMLAFMGSLISVRLPFGVIVLLVLMAMGCLMLNMRYIMRKSH